MSELHSHDPQQSPGAQPAAAGALGVSKTRRNLLRAGAIGAPALIALKPAPVSACTCKLPSGFTVSGNASRGPKNCQDPASKPLTWKGRTTQSGSKYYYYQSSPSSRLSIHKGTKVVDLGFVVGSYSTGTTPNTDTVDAWLNGQTTATGLIMACYLEACYAGNNSNFPSKDKFVAMWNAAVASNSGYTVANQATKWSKDQVLGYLLFLTAQVPT